jgi:hypothetical protein
LANRAFTATNAARQTNAKRVRLGGHELKSSQKSPAQPQRYGIDANDGHHAARSR